MKRVCAILFFVFSAFAGFSQNRKVFTVGTIEYDKTVNVFGLIRKTISKSKDVIVKQEYDKYVQNKPQFSVSKNILEFAGDKTFYTNVVASNAAPFIVDLPLADQDNVVFTDFSQMQRVAQKTFYGTAFLIKDTIPKIQWKITDETRVIAGYNCRRANAVILDSIYVVAFYADKIAVSGGPESFSGLPGMILGVALPHENVTWFATKVTLSQSLNNSLVPPVKGKLATNKQFRNEIGPAVESKGVYAIQIWKAYIF